MQNEHLLEELAISLRELLEIDPITILNPTHFDDLSEKIHHFFPNIKIILGDFDDPMLTLEDENYFKIYIGGNVETKFYDLVRLFTFAFLLDKKSLSQYELKYKVFKFPRYLNKKDYYFMLAFMMPKKSFMTAIIQYSDANGNIDMFRMQKEVNKYSCPRGKNLHIWN